MYRLQPKYATKVFFFSFFHFFIFFIILLSLIVSSQCMLPFDV